MVEGTIINIHGITDKIASTGYRTKVIGVALAMNPPVRTLTLRHDSLPVLVEGIDAEPSGHCEASVIGEIKAILGLDWCRHILINTVKVDALTEATFSKLDRSGAHSEAISIAHLVLKVAIKRVVSNQAIGEWTGPLNRRDVQNFLTFTFFKLIMKSEKPVCDRP